MAAAGGSGTERQGKYKPGEESRGAHKIGSVAPVCGLWWPHGIVRLILMEFLMPSQKEKKKKKRMLIHSHRGWRWAPP
jgi:hypothetical protein